MWDFHRGIGSGPGGRGGSGGSEPPAPGGSVSIQPASFKGAVLGRSAKITYAPTSDQIAQGIKPAETVALWQGNPYESQAMTIDFGTVLNPPLDTIGNQGGTTIVDARAYAAIQYGSGGSIQNSVVIDLARGQRVTVVASYISVNVGMDPPRANVPVGYPPAISPVMIVSATIGTFAAGSPQAPVIRTVYIDHEVAGQDTPLLVIPTRAVAMLPPTTGVSNDTIAVAWYSLGGTLLGEMFTTYSTANTNWAPVPIPPDAYFFVLNSLKGAPPTANSTSGIRVPFQLSL